MGLFSFRKSQRLTGKSQIHELFRSGGSFLVHPFKVLVRVGPAEAKSHQVLISVSKRNFKRAVDRNLIKRRIREAYRLNAGKLSEAPKLQIVYLYVAREILDFHHIEKKLIESFDRLQQYAQKG